ncbi:MAG TPA: ABC transporter permease [Gaiellales bacterium]|jgi:peptide/nickel transport system permease protein|nr:ABC transporter permease [Gaiellales bacterium]
MAERVQPAASVPSDPGLPRRIVGGTWRGIRLVSQNRAGLVGLILLAFFTLIAIFGSWIAPQDPGAASSYSSHILAPPSSAHWLGTEENGRDVLSLLILGTRVSMIVGISAALVSAVIGGIIGISAGFFGGWVDHSLTAVDDWFLVIPFLPLAIVLVSLLGQHAQNYRFGQISIVIIVIGVTGWAGTSRIIRSQVLSVKERMFLERSKGLGASTFWIMRKQVLPNVLPLIFANTVLIVAIAILSESTLSFLGLGDITHPSWGTMLDTANQAGAVSAGAWWYFIPPGICICLLVMAFTLVGYAIEELVNPRLRERR